jgi:hypothetical protein
MVIQAGGTDWRHKVIGIGYGDWGSGRMTVEFAIIKEGGLPAMEINV